MKKTKTIIIAVAALVALILVIIAAVKIFKPKDDSTVADLGHLKEVLTKESELTTAKLTITSVFSYEDANGIKFLNKNKFCLMCSSVVRAGIDIQNVEITSDDLLKTIYISIPKAEILDVKVEPSSLQILDDKFTLFPTDEKEALVNALEEAQVAAEIEAANTGILELANEQSETLIKGLLANAIPEGYTIEVKP